jgi:hypothetical protein
MIATYISTQVNDKTLNFILKNALSKALQKLYEQIYFAKQKSRSIWLAQLRNCQISIM